MARTLNPAPVKEDYQLIPMTFQYGKIMLCDMTTGERTEVRCVQDIDWHITPGGGPLILELDDDPAWRALDIKAAFYGLYLQLDNGQELGPWYFENTVRYAGKHRGQGKIIWTMGGPYMRADERRGA